MYVSMYICIVSMYIRVYVCVISYDMISPLAAVVFLFLSSQRATVTDGLDNGEIKVEQCNDIYDHMRPYATCAVVQILSIVVLKANPDLHCAREPVTPSICLNLSTQT